MSKDVFDRIGASYPVNKQAALSSSKGFDYTPSKIVTNAEWDFPPNLKPTLSNQFDLAGIRKGRLVVIGVLEIKKTSKHNRATWVCRCDCSRYVARTAKAINNPENKEDRCSLCKHTAFLQGRHNIKPKATPSPQTKVVGSDQHDLNVWKAKAISRGKLLERFRDLILNMADNVTNEGDRVYFGSTNDYDELREIGREMDMWKWDAIMRERPEPDPYASCREQRARADKAEANLAGLKQQIEAAREFVKRHPALTLIDLAEFEAFLKVPAAMEAALALEGKNG